MIHGFKSVGFIIAKLYRDLKLRNPEYDQDAIEWAGEALAFIGHGIQFTRETLELSYEDYKVKLPHGVYRIYRVISEDHIEYVVKDNYIHLSQEVGTLSIDYVRVSTDEDGYPYVPDSPNFSNAITWYIMRQMILGGWQHPSGIDFDKADRMWLRYCSHAASEGAMPTLDEYDGFMKSWLNMLGTITPKYQRSNTSITYGSKISENSIVSAPTISSSNVNSQFDTDVDLGSVEW